MTRHACLVLLAAVCLAGPAGAAETDVEVSRKLFAEVLSPVAEAAESVSATGIAVRGVPASEGPEKRFFEEVGDRLLDRGFDVWVIPADEPVPSGVLALDLDLTLSEIDYPEQTRAFLGIGHARVQRRVALGAQMRLTDPQAGRLIYNAEPVRVQREWMSFSEAHRNAEQRPEWMGAEPIQDIRARNPWWQRSLVVGIVAGVAVVYFSGAN